MRWIVNGSLLTWTLTFGLSALVFGQIAPGTNDPTPAPPQGTQAPATGQPQPAPAQPAQQPPAQAQPPADPEAEQKLDQILARWEQESARTSTLYAAFDRVDMFVLLGDEKRYQGKAFLKRPNLAILDLKKQSEGDVFALEQRIVCNGNEVVEFDVDAKQITVFPLPKDARQRALEEGPLQFLFDMKVDRIKQRYRMRLDAENERQYRIFIEPLLPIDRDAFAAAYLDLNRETLLPDKLYMLSANGKDQQRYTFTEVRKGDQLQDELFSWKKLEGWQVIVNPSPDDVRLEAPGGPQPGAVGQRPDRAAPPRQ